jgi:hypothetical protein
MRLLSRLRLDGALQQLPGPWRLPFGEIGAGELPGAPRVRTRAEIELGGVVGKGQRQPREQCLEADAGPGDLAFGARGVGRRVQPREQRDDLGVAAVGDASQA